MKALVIPAYQPSGKLIDLLSGLPAGLFAAIVVVDDGSGPEYAEVFSRAGALADVRIAEHAVHVGRGAAIRTGINAALLGAPELTEVVTADWRHSPEAVLQIAGLRRPWARVTLGTHAGSRRGYLTRGACRALVGVALSEPETKLRALPAALLPHLLRMESNGPEFEIESLIVADQASIPIVELPVEAGPPPAISAWYAPLALLRFAIASRPYRAAGFAFALITAAILAAATAAGIHGFAAGHLFDEPIWLPWGQRRLGHFAAYFAAVSLPLLLMVPWTYVSLFAAVIAVATLLATGPLAAVGMVFFLTSACALGWKVLGKSEAQRPEAHVCATLLGVAIYAFTMTLTARIPVNYPAVWATVLAIPILLDARGVARRFRELTMGLRSSSLPQWPERIAFAVLAFVLCIHWFAAIEPETSADGLGVHLAIAANMAAHHAMTFRPDLFLWSVMPMAGDFSYSVVNLVGGEAAVSLFNFALLLAVAALIYSATRRWLSRAPALLVSALFASTPLAYLVTGSLFIENFIAAMILGMLAALWRFRETGDRRLLFAAAALGGTAAAGKLGAALFALLAIPAAVFAVHRQWKNLGVRPALTAALAMGLLLAVAAPPYAIAYAKTGDPVFPFLNTKFPSPLLERGLDLRDLRYRKPLAWTTPFDLTFHTNDFFEAQNGGFGLQYLLLIPLAFVALLALRDFAARTAAAIALTAGVVIMATEPNARYLYAALPLLTVAFGGLLARFSVQQQWLTRALMAAAAICIGLNVYFEPASGWYHRHFYSVSLFRPHGRDQYVREIAPMRDVAQRFRRAQPLAPVLLVSENDLTDAGDHVYEYGWHQYAIWKRIATVKSVAALREVFDSLGVRYFVAHRLGPDEDPIFPISLGEFLANCTTPEFEDGRFYAARTTAACESLSGPDLETWLANLPPALVSLGVYDDFDPAIRFRGHWTRSRDFTGPHRHTVSYTNVAGDEATFAFQGTSLTYVYSKSFNRGIAQLIIDGEAHTIDEYSPKVDWQSRAEFCCLNPGRHVVVLRATGEKRAQAREAYIDLDAFIVK